VARSPSARFRIGDDLFDDRAPAMIGVRLERSPDLAGLWSRTADFG